MTREADRIPGLIVHRAFLAPEACQRLVGLIDQAPWSTELKRRVQHYGFRYNYRQRSQALDPAVSAIPSWGGDLIGKMLAAGVLLRASDQIIVNEFLPGQGIASHIDSVAAFDDEIASLSLGSACVITFQSVLTAKVVPVLLEVGDVLVIRNEARYSWRHGIAARKTDMWQSRPWKRGRRVSVTFRKVIPA